jgi:hypothetical protein
MTNYLLYIDPGTGSLLFQLLLSGLLTVVLFFKRGIHYVKALFLGKKDQAPLFDKKNKG